MITLSNQTVRRDAAPGAFVGAFNVPVALLSGNRLFSLGGRDLMVAWDGRSPPPAGHYKVEVRTLPAGPRVPFMIHVVAPPVVVAQATAPAQEPAEAPAKKSKPVDAPPVLTIEI